MKTVLKNMRNLLAVTLAFVMVIGTVPQNLFAAEVSADQNAVEAGTEDLSIDAVNAENADEEMAEDAVDAAEDVNVWFNDPAALITPTTSVNLYDLTTVENNLAKGAPFDTDAKKKTSDLANNGHRVATDHNNGYTFIVEPKPGYALKGNIVKSLAYDNYTSDSDFAEVKLSTKSGNWVVEDYDSDLVNYGSKKVTITAAALDAAYKGGRVVSGQVKGREISVEFETTLTETAALTIPIVCYDDTVELEDRIPGEFTADIDKDDEVALNANVKNFDNYSVTNVDSGFLSVVVYDEYGKVVTTVTDCGLAGGTVINVTGEASHDYYTLCGAGGANNFDANITTTADLGTEQWVAYVSENGVKKNGEAESEGNPMLTKGTVIIAKSALQVMYSAGYTAEIVVSAAAEESKGLLAVSYADASDGFVTYKNSTLDGDAPTTATKNTDFSFGVVPKIDKSPNRQVDKVWYQIGSGDEQEVLPVAGVVTIDDAEVTDDITIRTESSEDIVVAGEGKTNVTVLSTAGVELPDVANASPTMRADDGEYYEFIVIAKDGYEVDTIQTGIGTGTNQTITPVNGVYKTTKKIDGALTITTKVKGSSGGLKQVVLSEDNDNATVTALRDVPQPVTTTAEDYVEVGKPFYFTVANVHDGDQIESVFVKLGDGASQEIQPIAHSDAVYGTNWYVVTGANGAGVDKNIEITVKSSASTAVHDVYAVENDKATFSFAEAGKSVKAGEGTTFEFTVDVADKTTTEITEVGYYYDENHYSNYTIDASKEAYASVEAGNGEVGEGYLSDIHVLGTKAGDYEFTVPSDFHVSANNKNIVVYALTKEKVPSSTYRFAFKDQAGTLSQNQRVASEYSSEDDQTIDTLVNQELRLVLSDDVTDLSNTLVYPYDKTKRTYDNTPISFTGTNWLTFKLKAASNVVVLDPDENGSTYEVVAHSKGNAILTAELTTDDADRGPLNRLSYTKDLDVTVTGLYTDLEIVASSDSFYPETSGVVDNEADLQIWALDGQTQQPVRVSADGNITNVPTIKWSFVKSIEKTPVAERKYGYGLSYGYESAAREPSVYAREAMAESFQVKATITYADGTEEEVPAKALKCVEKPAYDFFYVTNTSGAVVIDNYKNTTDYPVALDGIISLGLAENDEKSATIKYDVYQILDNTKWVALTGGAGFVRGTTTKDVLEEGERKGYIEKVDDAGFSGVGADVYDNTNTIKDGVAASKYATLSGENGEYTLTAVKNTETDYVKLTAPIITINGVTVTALNTADDAELKVSVTNAQRKQTVDLVLYDSIPEKVDDVDGFAITEHKLNADFIASRPYSEVESKNAGTNEKKGAWTYGKITGARFLSVPRNSSFVLPTANDLATTLGSNRVLVGWQEYTSVIDGVADTAKSVYKKPGDSVDIEAANVVYKAIWADKYGISTVANGNIVTTGTDDYDETIKNTKKYDTPLGDIAKGGTVPVVLKVTEAYSVDTENATTTPVVEGKSKYITTGFTLTAKDANTEAAVTIGKDTNDRPTVTGKNLAESKELVVKAEWESESGKISAESEPFHVVPAATFEVSLDKEEISVEEGQDPTTAVINSEIKIGNTTYGTLSDNPNDPNYKANFSFIWSNASETEAQLATIATKYDKGGDETSDKLVNYVSGLKKTTEPITLKLTASNAVGQTDTKEVKVTVNAPKVTIKLYQNNEAKTEITNNSFEAFADSDVATEEPSERNSFLVKAFDENGSEIKTATWSLERPLTDGVNNVLTVEQPTNVSAISDGSGYKVVQLDTEDTVDTDKLTILCTAGGVTYSKDVAISTCYAVGLVGYQDTTKINTYVTENGTKVVDADGNPSFAFIRLGVDKKIKAEKGNSFSFRNISLSGYSAVYENTDTNPDTKTFDHWTHEYSVDYATEIESLKKSDFNGGIYVLSPVMTPEFTITGIPGTITLDHNLPGETRTQKSIDVEITPALDDTSFYVRSSDIGLFNVGYVDNNGDLQMTAAAAVDGNELIAVYVNKAKTKAEGTLVLGKAGNDKRSWRAGKATLDFYATATSTKKLATATLYVNGIDYDEDTEVRSYYEKGEKVKSTMRTVYSGGVTTTYYFDENGAQITGSGVYTIDGKKVLILAGNVAESGVQYFDNNEYYVMDGGVIKTAELVEVNGVQRYVNSDGILVTYAMATNGKYTDPATHVTYVITEGTNAAALDDILYDPTVKWVQTFPKTWKKTDPKPVVAYTITVTSKETGKRTTTDSIIADVKESNTTKDDTEVITLEATANLSGYFKDSEGKTPATAENVANSKLDATYTFKNGSEEGQTGGSEGHEIDTNPTTEEEIEDISADKFKAYQVEPTLNLYDKNATVTVYFVGTTADPDEVEFAESNSYYEIKDTLTGSGYTKAVIGIKDSVTFDQLTAAEKAKKLTFNLYKGESKASVTFGLKVNKKLPSVNLSVKSGTAYSNADGEYNAVFTTTDKNGVLALEGTNAIYVANKDSKDAVTDITVDTEDGITQIKYANAGAQAKGGLYVTNDNWVEGASIFAAFKISNARANAKPAIKLGKTSAKIAAAADQRYATTALLGGAVSDDLEVNPVSGKSSEYITADLTDGVLSFTTTEGIAAGTYEFTVNTKSDAAVAAGKAVTFKLTVADASKATASFTVKGKLDSIADDTAVYITVKPTGADGEVELTEGTIKAIENNKLTVTPLGNGVFKIEKDVNALMSGEKAVVPYIAKGNIEISDFKVTVGGVAVNSKKAVKVKIPVAFGKLTASGTGIDFRNKNAATGSSSIEAVYTYSMYNEAGKVVGKNYYTFAGSSVKLSDPKAGNLSVEAGSDGLVTVKNPSDGKDYNGTVKVTVPGTDIKAVSAKFKVLGKVKK